MDGEATYGAMLDAIAAAESYVLVQFYIVMDDTVARRVRDALIEKAQAGVLVYFLYDEIGCWSLPATYLDSMRDASIEVSGFKTARCEPVDLAHFDNKPLWFRVAARIARLASPLL